MEQNSSTSPGLPYVDDANVQTTHKENAVSRINRAAFESGIDPMDPVTHATGCLMNISNGQIAQPNVNAAIFVANDHRRTTSPTNLVLTFN